jgi:hypothetical protein
MVAVKVVWFTFMVFNATFSNISAIPWRPVLMVEEAGVPGENHRPWASNFLIYNWEKNIEELLKNQKCEYLLHE